MSFVYYEGAFMPLEDAHVPVTDRGLLFGDGAYATIQVRSGHPLFLETHLGRLREQCASFNLEMPPINPSHVAELIRLNGAYTGIWRLKIVVTGGDAPELFLPERGGRVFMFLKPHTPLPMLPLKIGLFSHPFNLCHAGYKSLAHLNRLYVMQEACRLGVDDCLTVTERGVVLETAFGNLCWFLGKTLYTPSRTLPLYFGVTLTKLIEAAREQGYRVEEGAFTVEKLPDEGVYFRTNSIGGIWPIAEIAGQKKGHPIECPVVLESLQPLV